MFLIIHNCSFSVTSYWKGLHVHLHSGTLEVQNASSPNINCVPAFTAFNRLSQNCLWTRNVKSTGTSKKKTFPLQEPQVLSHHHFGNWSHWWCLDLFGFTLSEANTLGHTAHCGLRSLPVIVLVKSQGYSLVLVEAPEQRPGQKSYTFRSAFHVMDGDSKWCRQDGLRI